MVRVIKFKRLVLAVLVLAVVFFISHSNVFLRLFYPLPYREEVFRYSRQFGLDPYLVFAVMRVESGFDPYAESPKGALGLMQLMPDTAKWAAAKMNIEYNKEKLYEPGFNILAGCWYLSMLKDYYGNSLPAALAAYNGGKSNVDRWLESKTWSGRFEDVNDIPFGETREYVRNVLRNYETYRMIYEG